MPKLTCLCGQSINLSVIPNPDGFKLVWEPSIEKVIDEIVVAHHQNSASDQAFEKSVYDIVFRRKPEFPQVYECSNCHRLAILANSSDAQLFWFNQEQRNGEATSIRSLVQEIDIL